MCSSWHRDRAKTSNGFQARPLPHVVWREYVKPHISGRKGMAHACHGIVHQLKTIANQRLAHYGHATCNKTDVDKDISIEAGSNRLAAESPTVDGDHMSANQSPGAGGFLECQRRAIFSNSLRPARATRLSAWPSKSAATTEGGATGAWLRIQDWDGTLSTTLGLSEAFAGRNRFSI